MNRLVAADRILSFGLPRVKKCRIADISGSASCDKVVIVTGSGAGEPAAALAALINALHFS